ncbi:bifunctional aspartate kinase/homoserine dehydrogenase I [Spongiivirga sp. MCCC 1A20706]|uniref:bifunctional aspartate kinase/homoserine dehydrogenase I n=1 Tax=Spongiivirga sp. MCCC 1A20706 TaxID=3160963 RepID=UPI003977AAAD
MNVLKFGGTSVANPENIRKTLAVVRTNSKDSNILVVVSAFGGVTDLLLKAADLASKRDEAYHTIFQEIELRHIDAVKALIPVTKQSAVLSGVKTRLNGLETLFEGAFLLSELSPKTADLIAGHGELLSSYIISETAKYSDLDAEYKDSRTLIITSDAYGKASVDFNETEKRITEFLKTNRAQVNILPGFVASTIDGNTTTLGRGGSDYTAAILASLVNANELQIWTDVSGMYTANPRIVKQAFPIKRISYREAMELSHFGAKVIYPPTIQPVLEKEIPIWIKNTFSPDDEGTLITNQPNGKNRPVKGISHIENIALITLEGSGMIGIPGVSKRFLEVFHQKNTNVIMITQASSEQSICVGVNQADADTIETAINEAFELEIVRKRIEPVQVEKDLAILALVGDRMKSHQGLSGKMFSALGKNNVNIRAIAQGASEKNISAVIAKTDVKKGLNILHEEFFEDRLKQLNLFITGVGNVGGKLLQQIKQQQSYLNEKLRLNIRVIALSNSRTMVFDEKGIALENWEALLEKGEKASPDVFLERTTNLNIRNSIFVDNTATDFISRKYSDYLRNSIGVVTCNKIACADEYENYEELQRLSRKYGGSFLYETNVGAGLPIIDTLNNLVASGDQVNKIQAVLSGSLNFVFNNFDDNTSFHDVVKQAQEEGYTEPDPKIDLSGVDVARKILILARESGYRLELSDINNESFLPEESLHTKDNDSFFKSLITHEASFNQLLANAKTNNCRLKYVAQFENGKANVGLQQIPEDHPFYDLQGSDNIVLFYTNRYSEQPLIIKGAGAGADVTASGIFADIIRIGKN